MSNLKNAFHFYLSSSIHVGIAVACLVKIADPTSSNYAWMVFFGTILSYNFLKYKHLFFKNTFEIIRLNKIIASTLVAFIGFLFLFLQQKSNIQLQIGFAGFLVLLYPVVRKMGWFKIFYVSFVVSCVTLWIPVATNDAIEILFLHRFLVLTILLLPFEIVDVNKDPLHLKTIPQLVGIENTKRGGYLFLMASCFVVFFYLPEMNNLVYKLVTILMLGAIYFATENRSKYYTLFWIESIPIVWWLLIYFYEVDYLF